MFVSVSEQDVVDVIMKLETIDEVRWNETLLFDQIEENLNLCYKLNVEQRELIRKITKVFKQDKS